MVFPSQLLRKEINFIEGELKAAEGYSLRIGLDVKNCFFQIPCVFGSIPFIIVV